MIDIYPAIRPLLFALPPEAAHAGTLTGLKLVHHLGLVSTPSIAYSEPIKLMGLQFTNRLGLAAGLDKNGACVDALGALGFGFIEIGTITPRAQRGNARPRLFRQTTDQALINRMGFPNDGSQAIAERLRHRRYRGTCGVNIGKNAATPLNAAADDYSACIKAAYSTADYFAINISSPNTTELRRLQNGDLLQPLLSAVKETCASLQRESGRRVPVLVKLTADLDDAALTLAARTTVRCAMDGIIATNTTLARTESSRLKTIPDGGLSGAPLLPSALRAVQCIRAEVGSQFPVIGVGGIACAADAVAMRAAGADLVQIYTGLIYRGPALIAEILSAFVSA